MRTLPHRFGGMLCAWLVFAGTPAMSCGEPVGGEVRDQAGEPLGEAVITATPTSAKGMEHKPAPAVIDQRGKEFLPHVLAVQTGTAVNFPNSDKIHHHVYSFSPANKFEIKLYKGTPPNPIHFDRPGVAVIGCNIHDWMIGYIYVADTPYLTQTDGTGRWKLDLPPGSYKLSIWHPDMEKSQTPPMQDITLRAQEPALWSPVLTTTPTHRTGKPPASLQVQVYPGDP